MNGINDNYDKYEKWFEKINGMCTDKNLIDRYDTEGVNRYGKDGIEGNICDRGVLECAEYKLNDMLYVYQIFGKNDGKLRQTYIYPNRRSVHSTLSYYDTYDGKDYEVNALNMSISYEDNSISIKGIEEGKGSIELSKATDGNVSSNICIPVYLHNRTRYNRDEEVFSDDCGGDIREILTKARAFSKNEGYIDEEKSYIAAIILYERVEGLLTEREIQIGNSTQDQFDGYAMGDLADILNAIKWEIYEGERELGILNPENDNRLRESIIKAILIARANWEELDRQLQLSAKGRGGNYGE